MASTTQNDESSIKHGLFAFTLRLADGVVLTDELHDAIFEAGFDDVLLHECDGRVFMDFEREGESLTKTIVAAIQAIESSGVGLSVAEVIPPGSNEIHTINAILCARRDAELFKSLEKPR